MGSVALFVPHVGCPQQCSFCDQRAITGGAQPPEPWQVWQTAQAAASHLGRQVKDTEIAFFGGSFTAIPRGQMLSLLAPAKEAVERFGFRGLRCSTRPDAIDGEVLSLLKAYHMVTVELGAQSMDGEVLRRNRRGHSPEDTVRAAVNEVQFAQVVNKMRESKEAKLNIADIPSVVKMASASFGISEAESEGVFQHLIQDADYTLFGLANAVTRYSQDVESYDRATKLEEIGYSVMTMSPALFRQMNRTELLAA